MPKREHKKHSAKKGRDGKAANSRYIQGLHLSSEFNDLPPQVAKSVAESLQKLVHNQPVEWLNRTEAGLECSVGRGGDKVEELADEEQSVLLHSGDEG